MNARDAVRGRRWKSYSQLPEIKCINCGYRVLKKVRPTVVKKVQSI